MKIEFVGTSHGHSEKRRHCTSVYFEHKDQGYFIDLGAPVEYFLTNNDIPQSRIKSYFITHMHADHVASLFDIIKDYTGYDPDCEAELFIPEPAAIEPMKIWSKAVHLNTEETFTRLRIHEVSEGVIYQDDGIRVTAIRTRHISDEIPSYSYMVETDDNKRVLFTGDLTSNLQDFPEIAKREQFNLIVSELVHLDNPVIPEVLKDVRTDMMIFSHLGQRNVDILKSTDDKLNVPYVVACDGFIYYVV